MSERNLERIEQDRSFIEKIINSVCFKESGKMIAIATFGCAIIAFFLKSLWYFYRWGNFHALNIDMIYLGTESESRAIYSVTSYITVVVLFILSNTLIYKCMKQKEYKAIILIIIIEVIILCAIVLMLSNIGFMEILYEIIKEIKQTLLLLFYMLIIVLTLNLWGLLMTIPLKSEGTDIQGNFLGVHLDLKKIKLLGALILLIIFIQCLVAFVLGVWEGNDRTEFKLILAYESSEDLLGSGKEYLFYEDDKEIVVNAVLFETQDKYITCYCYEKDGKIYANTQRQKVIPKDGVMTIEGDNIEIVN